MVVQSNYLEEVNPPEISFKIQKQDDSCEAWGGGGGGGGAPVRMNADGEVKIRSLLRSHLTSGALCWGPTACQLLEEPTMCNR